MGNGTSFCTTECERHVEINASPKHPRDYPGGVWTLSPTQWQAEVDRWKYLAIGESDRLQPEILAPFLYRKLSEPY
jgi:hypothetical protein